jgi:hypothetical protein
VSPQRRHKPAHELTDDELPAPEELARIADPWLRLAPYWSQLKDPGPIPEYEDRREIERATGQVDERAVNSRAFRIDSRQRLWGERMALLERIDRPAREAWQRDHGWDDKHHGARLAKPRKRDTTRLTEKEEELRRARLKGVEGAEGVDDA